MIIIHIRMIVMRFYSQTLDDIPKEFMSHQKSRKTADMQGSRTMPETEDLLFLLAVLLFLQDEPLFSEPAESD